ncbi:MAG: hypothetical protein IPQ00_00125 [Chloracidobacterium sp.]|nr:hypothetical protein [Chloracidobacterium sp.]
MHISCASDAGIVGALIGLAFLFLIYRSARKGIAVHNLFRRGIAIVAFSGIFAILIHSVCDFVLHTIGNIDVLSDASKVMLNAALRKYPDDEKDLDHHEHRKRRSIDPCGRIQPQTLKAF